MVDPIVSGPAGPLEHDSPHAPPPERGPQLPAAQRFDTGNLTKVPHQRVSTADALRNRFRSGAPTGAGDTFVINATGDGGGRRTATTGRNQLDPGKPTVLRVEKATDADGSDKARKKVVKMMMGISEKLSQLTQEAGQYELQLIQKVQ